MRIAFTTFGCKINQYETDLMRRDAQTAGNAVVPFDDKADVYIINTCSVTAKSDYQCRQAIRSAVRRGQGARVVVTGCYADTRPEEIKKIPGVDLVIGNREKTRITDYVAPSSVLADMPITSMETPVKVKAARGERTRGFLKIQDGCDNGCSYCIVPLARGRSKSAEPEDVIREFEHLIQSECPEIVLTGIHIGTYGADLAAGMNLTKLITALIPKRRGARIRLSSIEPREITQEIRELLGHGLCRHLHIPLQSGDDSILNAMRRDYTSGFYLDLLWNISKQVPGIALGADVMVGFPGEGVSEFQNTFKLIENSPLTHLHVFSFSPRPGTAASNMKGQVSERVKKQRNEALRELGKRKNHAFRQRFLNSELSVIAEDKKNVSDGCLSGLTDNYMRVAVRGLREDAIGKEIPVKITEITESETIGIVLATR